MCILIIKHIKIEESMNLYGTGLVFFEEEVGRFMRFVDQGDVNRCDLWLFDVRDE